MILVADRNKNKLEKKAKVILEEFTDRIKDLNLKINPEKTKYMCSVNYRNNPIRVKIRNTQIERVKCIRYLGIKMDNKLKYNEHTKDIAKKFLE